MKASGTVDTAPVAPARPAPVLAGTNPHSPVRPDVAAKLDGSFSFANDVTVPGVLHGATVRSPHPHAAIRAVDTARALAVPGVVAVLTAADVPGADLIGHIVADQPVFASDVVRYQGEPVAFVVARSQATAWRAAECVDVTYEPLPAVVDPGQALAPGAPDLHPGGNSIRSVHLCRGEPFRGATIEVSGVWETGRQDQAFLAPESAMARPDPDGGVTLEVATQDLHTDRAQIAAALGVDESIVRLRLAGVGGAFGGREDITLHVHLCLAALHLGRPVRTTYRRGESFLAHPKRHPARLWYTIGADGDGRLQFVRARILLDGGAYASTSAPVLGSACYFAAGPYRVPSVDIVGDAVYTNNPVSGAMRGFGAVQACFGIESTMDRLAAALGLDPVELRRRNVLHPGDRFPTSGQLVGEDASAAEVLERCAERPLLPDRHDDAATTAAYARPGGPGGTTRGEGVRRGVGFAMGVKQHLYGEGTPEWSTAKVRVSRAGAEVVSAATECGQGVGGVLVHVAEQQLGAVPARLAVASSADGYAGSSSASRQTWMAGNAVRLAAIAIADELRRRGIEPDDPPSLRRLGDDVIEREATYHAPPTRRGDPETGAGDVHVSWMFVAHRAVVDVDVELGLVRVVHLTTAQDVGRAINRREILGQIRGGISQGVGLAVMEHLHARDGVAANASFTDYLIPTVADMPTVDAVLVESPDPRNPLGVRGAGEPSSLSSTASVAAAIRAATDRLVPRVPVRPDDLVGPFES